MGQRGPTPKPSSLKKLHGTFRTDRAPENEATPPLATGNQLKAPDWLSEGATQKWDELALRLHRLGLLTEVDLDVFSLYCVTWDRWREAEELVQKEGAITVAQSGYQAVSPHVTRAKNRLAELIKLSGLLGLSPSARTKIDIGVEKSQSLGLLA